MNVPDLARLISRTPSSSVDADISPEAFNFIVNILREAKGFKLDIYKEKCMKRRIAIRMRKTSFASASEYVQFLRENTAELDHLLKALTIHVSHFFRNRSVFEKLKEEVIPSLFSLAERHGHKTLKIWSVGCASGEEPYSVALILQRDFAHLLSRRNVTLLATDIDAHILETAKSGLYSEERLVEVCREERDFWFTEEQGKFRLAQEIMDMVTFRQGDLSDAAPFPESDLILCRNVLIYLDRVHQEAVLKRFAAALRPGGMLILGKAETLAGESRRRFQTVCPLERIYQVPA